MSSPRFGLYFAALSLLPFASGSSAQTAVSPLPAPAAVPLAQGATSYSSEPLVLERLSSVVQFNADGTGYRERTVVVKIQSEAAVRQLGVVSVPFASASERVEMHYVRVREPNGTVTETPISSGMEQPEEVTRMAPFYSDLKQLQVPVRNLRVGDTLEWQGRVVRTRSEAPGQFWGQETFVSEGGVVLAESMELRVPAGKAVTVWTNPGLGAKPVEAAEGAEHVYRWTQSYLKPTVGKEAEAAALAKKTRLLTLEEQTDMDEGRLPSVAFTTFPSWEAVGAWYHSLVGQRSAPDEEIKAKVAEITAGKTSQEEKLRAVYEYASTQIRYIGVAFGTGRYQPHTAADVLHNQYGDCKDKEVLLAAMLAALGQDSDAALIGAGVRFNKAVPSPEAFNHLIAHVKLNGKDVWLDPTAEVAPFGMLLPILRDHAALVVPGSGAAHVERTTDHLPFEVYQKWTAKGTLGANGTSESRITLSVRGDNELGLREALRQVGPAQYTEFAQKIVNTVGYGGTASRPEFSRVDDIEAPFMVSFDYHREGAGDWANLRIIPQLAPVDLPMVDEKEPPVAEIKLGVPRVETSTAEMTLPKGWTAELPEAVHEKATFATYDLSYRFENGTLYTERRVTVLEQKVPAKDWKTYKKWADAVSLGMEMYVPLHKPGGTSLSDVGSSITGAGDSGTQGDQEEARKLVQQAAEATKKMDVETASVLLGKAKKMNPKQPMLWAGFGYVAYQKGEMNKAIESLQKEVALHPDSVSVYPVLVTVLERKGDLAQMERTLRAWRTASPLDPKPLKDLAALLIQGSQPEAALEAAEEAEELMSPEERKEDTGLQLVLGRAQLAAGKTKEGAATLKALLVGTQDLGMMNELAYQLADAGQELPLADEKERFVLERLTSETRSWTFDESLNTMLSRSNLLIASWDTMGWILFREGKAEEAKSYVEAAWANRPNNETHTHVEQVNAALHLLRDAKAEAGGARQKQAGNISDEQQQRTIMLGPANGRKGVAEYRLLLAHGKILQVRPTGEKTVEGAEAMIREAKLGRMFPEGSEAQLVRGAMVNCYGERCQLVLMP
ncbi:MAG TPA: DUF3857 domain-containing protein [Acidobacteriaceae bacterium]|jgi:tetratricopeptide (TPR) repeat protein|nr:DUF3857 domain-containing protein [Acidobacteriaceae bacterium]